MEASDATWQQALQDAQETVAQKLTEMKAGDEVIVKLKPSDSDEVHPIFEIMVKKV